MALSETMLTYTKTLKEDHTFNVLAGFSYQYDQEEYNGGSGRNSPSDKIQYVPNGFPTLAEKEIYDYKEVIPLQAYESDMKEKSLLSWFAVWSTIIRKSISFQQVFVGMEVQPSGRKIDGEPFLPLPGDGILARRVLSRIIWNG